MRLAAVRHACCPSSSIQAAKWLILLLILLIALTDVSEAVKQAGQSHQQQRCPSPKYPATPFPTSFWLVKTIKTGSTTLASILRQICSHYGVVPVNKRRINPLEGLTDAAAAKGLGKLVLEARNATDASEFAVITHLNFSEAKVAAFADALGGRSPLLLTSVRHPLARTYSHFIQAKCANAAGILGGKIIECDRNETYFSKLLELDTVRNRWNFVRIPSRHNLVYNYIRGNASTAEAALSKYDFVFVSERMDEALVVFMMEFGLKFQDIAYLSSKNRTGKYKAGDQMPDELNQYVLSVNAQDLLVWQQANKLLDEKVAQLETRCGKGAVASALGTFHWLQAEVATQCADFKIWYKVNKLPEQYTYVNDEGWGWRCVRHVAQQAMEGSAAAGAAAAAGGVRTVDSAVRLIT